MMREEAFAAAIGNRESAPPHPRFVVYRNNVASALINALRVRYPVTGKLVGGEFFAGMAGAFAAGSRPSSPVLIAYGAEFPDFIAAFPPAREVPYLSDVARLESLWWQSYHAADEASLAADELAAHPSGAWAGTQIRFVPSAFVFGSRFAVYSIWSAHNGGVAMGGFDVTMPEHVLISRTTGEVALHLLSEDSFRFLEALMAGKTLADAIPGSPGFDLQAELARLLSFNIIAGLRT